LDFAFLSIYYNIKEKIMSNLFIFLLVFGGAGAVIFAVIVIRTFVSPKKLVVLENLIASGNTKAAIRQAKTLLARNERSTDAHWYLGECYRAEKRLDLAAVEYKYITNTGRFTNAATQRRVRERLAHTYLELGQLDESQKEFILLSKLEPDNYEHFFNIGKLFEERNYTDSALTNYRKALSLNPQHAESYLRMGIIQYRKQQFNEAKKSLTMSLKLDTQNSAPYFYLGKIAKTTGDSQLALSQFEKAKKDTDLRQRALFERASIFIVKGDRNSAVAELERAIKLGEENVPVILASRYMLAQCYEVNKDLGNAIEQWEQIYETNPKYKDVAEKLALYSDLRTDDRLKDFLTASQEAFKEYCEKIVESLGLAIQDIFLKSQDIAEVFALETQSRWRNAKKAPSIVKIYRSVDPIGYDAIRVLYDQMRKLNAMRSICITASKFTRTAVEFAQIRPIDLIDKEELTKLLDTISR
jgi:tetratricopeptide (TPR) repeat protein